MSEIFYKKVGRKYVPINDPNAWDGLTEGVWIVNVKPGSKSARVQVFEDFDGLNGALESFVEDLVDAMLESSKIHPSNKTTAKQEKHWSNYIKSSGEDVIRLFSYPSIQSIAQNAIKLFKTRVNDRKNRK